MRIGLLGGSFNPIHLGHIKLAQWSMEEFGLNRVLFVVAKDPPHKEIAQATPANMRHEMVRRAVEEIGGLEVTDMEILRGGKSYTVDTVREVLQKEPLAEIFLVLGEDMLNDLVNWRETEALLRLAHVISYARPGVGGDAYETKRMLEARYGARVFLGSYTGPDISSGMVRQAVYEAKPIRELVPPCVEEYIYEQGLYFPEEIKLMQEKLKATLKHRRYRHIMGTVRWAIELAHRHGMDTKKARLAALLHDCAKFAPDEQLKLAEHYGLKLRLVEKSSPSLLHGRLGAIYAREEYGVKDKEILDAIRCHTFCRLRMTRLDKLLYIADKTEPMRSFPGVTNLRRKAWKDLDAGTVACMDYSISHTRNAGKQLDNTIFKARKEILKSMRGQKK